MRSRWSGDEDDLSSRKLNELKTEYKNKLLRFGDLAKLHLGQRLPGVISDQHFLNTHEAVLSLGWYIDGLNHSPNIMKSKGAPKGLID